MARAGGAVIAETSPRIAKRKSIAVALSTRTSLGALALIRTGSLFISVMLGRNLGGDQNVRPTISF